MPAKVVTWQSGGNKSSRLVAFHWNASLELSENAVYTLFGGFQLSLPVSFPKSALMHKNYPAKFSYASLTFRSLLVTWCTNSLTFNSCTLCPHCIYVFCIYLRTNSDLCHLQHKLIGFYNRDEKCLQRGTDWVFKYSCLRLVCKGLKPCFVFIWEQTATCATYSINWLVFITEMKSV